MTTVSPIRPRTLPAEPTAGQLPRRGSGTTPLALRFFLVAVFFLPVQIDLGVRPTDGGFDTRFAPSDLFLAAALVVAPGLFHLRKRGVDALPFALVAVLGFGMVLAAVRTGEVTAHTLFVKFIGGIVLALLAVATAGFARAGYADRVIRTFLLGMAFWAVVSYLDWRIVDLLPFVEAKTESRFGGMQYDPNNAGAAYGVTVLLVWKLGPRLFKHRGSLLLVTAALVGALGLTLSRGGYVATVAAIALIVIAIDHPKVRQWVRLGAATAVVIAGVVLTGLAETAISDFTNRPDTVEDRSRIADQAITDFVGSHGFGIGLGTYRFEHREIVHNTALWLLVEMSVLGFAFWLAMAVVPSLAAIRLRAHDAALGTALLGAHVVMVIASMNIEALYQRQWWLIVGLIAGVDAMTSAAEGDSFASPGVP